MKEQVNIYLEDDLVRQINIFLERESPKYHNRSHFFEIAATELMKVGGNS